VAVFDAALAVTLVICLVRSARLRFVLGVGCTLLAMFVLGTAALGALRSGLIRGYFGTVMGVFFVGPSAVPHDALFGHPLVVPMVSCATAATAAVVSGRIASRLPNGQDASRWGRTQLGFVAVFTFGAIRLVTALLFAAVGG
jgi:hypothetical protein